MKNNIKQAGFTLVELAIVLVIIGLIVGGVLAGADLIKSATLQKAIKQINDVDTGANTFRTKYNELPGDLKNPATVFTTAYTGANSAIKGLGDGNGLIEASDAGAGGVTPSLGSSGEAAVFFHQLYDGGLIKEAMTTVAMAAYTATPSSSMFLASALGKGALLAPFSNGTNNFIIITGTPTAASVAGAVAGLPGITPLQASNIDSKLDDAIPNTGSVVSNDTAAPDATAGQGGSAATGDCYNVTTYNSNLTGQECTLSVRMSF